MVLDTLKWARELTAAGMERPAAEQLAQNFGEMTRTHLAAKSDMAAVQNQLALMQEQLALMQRQLSLGLPADAAADQARKPEPRRTILHFFTILVGALAAHTTLLAWLLDLF